MECENCQFSEECNKVLKDHPVHTLKHQPLRHAEDAHLNHRENKLSPKDIEILLMELNRVDKLKGVDPDQVETATSHFGVGKETEKDVKVITNFIEKLLKKHKKDLSKALKEMRKIVNKDEKGKAKTKDMERLKELIKQIGLEAVIEKDMDFDYLVEKSLQLSSINQEARAHLKKCDAFINKMEKTITKEYLTLLRASHFLLKEKLKEPNADKQEIEKAITETKKEIDSLEAVKSTIAADQRKRILTRAGTIGLRAACIALGIPPIF